MGDIVNKKNIIIELIIITVDIIVIGGWVLHINPDVSMGMYALFQICVVFLLNIIIVGVLYFIKRYYVSFFIINIFVSILIVHIFFNIITEKNMNTPKENWTFYIDNIEYNIHYIPIKKYNMYSITSNCGNGVNNLNGGGCVHVKNDTIYFCAVDSSLYYIYGDTLYNFENIGKIKVEKKY